jgi:hypothetical protein
MDAHRQINITLIVLTFTFLMTIISKGETLDTAGWKFPVGMTLDYQFINNKSYSLGIGFMLYCKSCADLRSMDRVIKKDMPMKFGLLGAIEYFDKDRNQTLKTFGFKVMETIATKFLNFGIGFGHFTDFSNFRFCFMPEFGIGFKSIYIVYRRNMTIIKSSDVNYFNRDNLSIRLIVPFNKRWFQIKK